MIYKNVRKLTTLRVYIIRFFDFYLSPDCRDITKLKRTDFYFNRNFQSIPIFWIYTRTFFISFKVELPANDL